MWVFKNIFHLMVSFGDRIFRSCKARVVKLHIIHEVGPEIPVPAHLDR